MPLLYLQAKHRVRLLRFHLISSHARPFFGSIVDYRGRFSVASGCSQRKRKRLWRKMDRGSCPREGEKEAVAEHADDDGPSNHCPCLEAGTKTPGQEEHNLQSGTRKEKIRKCFFPLPIFSYSQGLNRRDGYVQAEAQSVLLQVLSLKNIFPCISSASFDDERIFFFVTIITTSQHYYIACHVLCVPFHWNHRDGWTRPRSRNDSSPSPKRAHSDTFEWLNSGGGAELCLSPWLAQGDDCLLCCSCIINIQIIKYVIPGCSCTLNANSLDSFALPRTVGLFWTNRDTVLTSSKNGLSVADADDIFLWSLKEWCSSSCSKWTVSHSVEEGVADMPSHPPKLQTRHPVQQEQSWTTEE